MARKWISVRKNLRDDPRLLSIADGLGVTRNEALGALVLWFMWVDENTADGVLPHVTAAQVDSPYVTHQSGLFAELLRIGWAQERDDGAVLVTNFDDHMSDSAKRRKQDQERKADNRKKTAIPSAKCPQEKRTKSGPHNRDRDRDITSKKKSAASAAADAGFDWSQAPDGYDTPEVRAKLDEWQAYRRETRKGDWKPVTIRMKFRQFADAGYTPDVWCSAVDESISNAWLGVFLPKGGGRGGRKTKNDSRGPDSPYDFSSLEGANE